MPQALTSCLQHMTDNSNQVNREKSANATITPMIRVMHQHAVDGGELKLGCAYPCRCGSLLLPSGSAERCSRRRWDHDRLYEE